MPPTAKDLLGLPAFMVGCSSLFWCFQLAMLTGYIKFWKLDGKRNDVQGVLNFLKSAFRYKVLKLGKHDVCTRKCMYLANHRGWADFFIDMQVAMLYVVGARAVPLSRRAVGAAFPAFTSSLLAIKSILLFNRQGVSDTEKFNRWLDEQLLAGPQNSLLVYPEGKRSLRQESLPLKRGMLRYAFTRRLPVQVVITANKEQVLNERRRWAHFGRTLVTGCSEVLESSSYDDFDQFMAAVQAMWDAQWRKVHMVANQVPAGLPELQPAFPQLKYSPATVAKQTAALGLWTAALLAGGYCTTKAARGMATSPPAGPLLAVGLGAYTAASLAAASRPDVPRSSGGGGSISSFGASAAAADQQK